MSKVLAALIGAALVVFLSLSTGCDQLTPRQQPPADVAIEKAVSEMYRRAGIPNEATSTTVLGKHYRPAQDAWKVVACVEFDTDGSGTGRDCNDSFELYRMDTGPWMINGTVNGVYRWLELPESDSPA